MNITETCDKAEKGDDPVQNLVTDTEVAVVLAPDNGILEQALEHTQEIITGEIEMEAIRFQQHQGLGAKAKTE